MRKIYSFLLTLVLTCVSTVAWGYDVNITSDPENDYFSGSQAFPVADIISGLGLADEAALEALINGEGNNNVYLKTADDETNTYTGNHNEFWMNADGTPQGYGDAGTCWYAGLYYDPAGVDSETGDEYESEFYVKVGQMPNFFKKVYTDTDLSCTLYLYNGNGRLQFDVKLHVNAAPQATEVYLSKLTIVKDYTLPLNFTIGKSYEGKKYSATLEGVYDALGTTAEEFDANASAQTYVQTVKTIVDAQTEETSYELIDSLSHPEDAAGGAWFGRYANFDEQAGSEIPLAINAPKEWAAGCTFYTQEIALAEGEYSITSGQYPGTFTSTEDNDYTYLYLVNGDKAARIKVQVAMEEPQNVDPSEWTEVGTIDITQSTTKIMDYLKLSTPIENITEVASNLGLEDPSDITFYHLPTAGEGFSDDLSDGWGAWLNETGNYCAWGSDARVMVAYELAEGVYQISSLQMAGTLKDGDEFTFPVFLANPAAGKYYTVNFKYSIKLPESTIKQADWTQEGRLEYNVQLIPSETAYLLEQNTTVDVDYIKNKLGVDDINTLTLFGDVYYENPEEADADKIYTSQLTLTPEGGFWMKSVDGKLYPASWGDADAMGMDWQHSGAGIISWYNKPNTRKAGDTYTGTFYLVNEEKGQYVRIVCNIEFVDELGPEQEPVGSQDVLITLSEDTYNDDYGQYFSSAIDWEAAFTALEMTEDDFEGAIWMVQNRSGRFVQFGGTSEFDMESAQMDADGYFVDLENGGSDADIVFAVGLNISESPLQMKDYKFNMSLMGEEPEAGVVYATKVALKSEKGIYVFNIVGATEETMTGIKGTPVVKNAGIKFFDFSGREIPAPAKGYAIGTDGKKYYFNK